MRFKVMHSGTQGQADKPDCPMSGSYFNLLSIKQERLDRVFVSLFSLPFTPVSEINVIAPGH
jgi:hypothetical protein